MRRTSFLKTIISIFFSYTQPKALLKETFLRSRRYFCTLFQTFTLPRIKRKAPSLKIWPPGVRELKNLSKTLIAWVRLVVSKLLLTFLRLTFEKQDKCVQYLRRSSSSCSNTTPFSELRKSSMMGKENWKSGLCKIHIFLSCAGSCAAFQFLHLSIVGLTHHTLSRRTLENH